jgi:hypothetical protein
MKIVLALLVTAVVFGTYPIADSSATESKRIELPQSALDDSITCLRQYADQQSVDNSYKMQDLQISIAELVIIKNKLK